MHRLDSALDVWKHPYLLYAPALIVMLFPAQFYLNEHVAYGETGLWDHWGDEVVKKVRLSLASRGSIRVYHSAASSQRSPRGGDSTALIAAEGRTQRPEERTRRNRRAKLSDEGTRRGRAQRGRDSKRQSSTRKSVDINERTH